MPPVGKCENVQEVFCGPLTDYLLKNQKKKQFFLVSKSDIHKILTRNLIQSPSPFLTSKPP